MDATVPYGLGTEHLLLPKYLKEINSKYKTHAVGQVICFLYIVMKYFCGNLVLICYKTLLTHQGDGIIMLI